MIQMSCNVDRNEDPWRASRTVRLFGYCALRAEADDWPHA